MKARSAELSILEVSASPRIVKHAKTYHLRGSRGFTDCSMVVFQLGYKVGVLRHVLQVSQRLATNWKREYRTRVPPLRG